MGHSAALFRQNAAQIQQLEAALAQYGYRDLYAPLPPDDPLELLELAPAAQRPPPGAPGAVGCSRCAGEAAAARGCWAVPGTRVLAGTWLAPAAACPAPAATSRLSLPSHVLS